MGVSESPTYEPSGGQLSEMQTAFRQRQTWVASQLALCLLSLAALQPYRPPPLLLPPVCDPSCLFAGCHPLCASCYTVLFKALSHQIGSVFFIVCLFAFYVLFV